MKNNKGFSVVESLIVIGILIVAILICSLLVLTIAGCGNKNVDNSTKTQDSINADGNQVDVEVNQ